MLTHWSYVFLALTHRYQVTNSVSSKICSLSVSECNHHINGLVEERCNSIANALELHLSCTNPSISSNQFCEFKNLFPVCFWVQMWVVLIWPESIPHWSPHPPQPCSISALIITNCHGLHGNPASLPHYPPWRYNGMGNKRYPGSSTEICMDFWRDMHYAGGMRRWRWRWMQHITSSVWGDQPISNTEIKGLPTWGHLQNIV